jgi:N-acetylmuramoyl-L-alanine amidase
MSKDISEVFPRVFKSNTGIKITEKILDASSIEVYEIDKFSDDENNRNHYDDRNSQNIKYLVLHYTVINFPQTITTFTANKDNNRVSAHYVISELEQSLDAGKIIHVVPDDKRAWHAGISIWGNEKNLNYTSIGIEHVNHGFVTNQGKIEWCEFDNEQINSSIELCKYLVNKYNILPQNILAHSDIAPGRKEDTGPLFPWESFYKAGIGAWLDYDERTEEDIRQKYKITIDYPKSREDILKLLSIFGYDISNEDGAIKAFKAHYSDNQHAENYNSDITETLQLWCFGLVAKYITNINILIKKIY